MWGASPSSELSARALKLGTMRQQINPIQRDQCDHCDPHRSLFHSRPIDDPQSRAATEQNNQGVEIKQRHSAESEEG